MEGTGSDPTAGAEEAYFALIVRVHECAAEHAWPDALAAMHSLMQHFAEHDDPAHREVCRAHCVACLRTPAHALYARTQVVADSGRKLCHGIAQHVRKLLQDDAPFEDVLALCNDSAFLDMSAELGKAFGAALVPRLRMHADATAALVNSLSAARSVGRSSGMEGAAAPTISTAHEPSEHPYLDGLTTLLNRASELMLQVLEAPLAQADQLRVLDRLHTECTGAAVKLITRFSRDCELQGWRDKALRLQTEAMQVADAAAGAAGAVPGAPSSLSDDEAKIVDQLLDEVRTSGG